MRSSVHVPPAGRRSPYIAGGYRRATPATSLRMYSRSFGPIKRSSNSALNSSRDMLESPFQDRRVLFDARVPPPEGLLTKRHGLADDVTVFVDLATSDTARVPLMGEVVPAVLLARSPWQYRHRGPPRRVDDEVGV